MLIKDIKRMHISELLEKASALNIENAANLSRQELVYGILQAQARISGEIWGEGVLETLPEGFPRAEFQMEHGLADAVVPRSARRPALGELLMLHERGTGR